MLAFRSTLTFKKGRNMLKPGIIVHCIAPLNPSVYGVLISFPYYQIALNMGPQKRIGGSVFGGWVYPNHPEYTLWYTNSLLLKMAIEIVDLAIQNGCFPMFSLVFCMLTRGYPSYDLRIVLKHDIFSVFILTRWCSRES